MCVYVAEIVHSFAYKLHAALASRGVNVTVKGPRTYLSMYATRRNVLGVNGEAKYYDKLIEGTAEYYNVVKVGKDEYVRVKDDWATIK